MESSEGWKVTYYIADGGQLFKDGTKVDPEDHAWSVCAVHKSMIPLGSKVTVSEHKGFAFIARYTGSKAVGKKIDIYIGAKSNRKEALSVGRKRGVKVNWK